jgi:hypothetical protein
MDALHPERLLMLWEQGVRCHPIDRALLLLALAAPEIPVERLADVPISRCHGALMKLRRERFGNPFQGWIDCPFCAERMEITIDADQFPPGCDEGPWAVEVDGRRFRSPSHRDIAELIALGEADPERAAVHLLRACADQDQPLPEDGPALQTLLDQVDDALERDRPWIDPSLLVSCPACGEPVEADLDIAALLWEDIDCLARSLLDEVHRLALAYGWRQEEILNLSDQRRAAYLERLEA